VEYKNPAPDKDAEIARLAPYAKFARLFIERIGHDACWWESEDSEAVMPLAVEAGIADRVPYDPDVHGTVEDAEPGDEIWVWRELPEVEK